MSAQPKCQSQPVAPVSAVCAAFAAQPSAYPPEARRPDVAPPCGSVVEMANAEKERLQANFSRGRSRKRRSRTKLRGRARLRSGHNCPPCGQFRGFTRAFQTQRKTAGGRCGMKKGRRFKGNRGVPTKTRGEYRKMVKGKEKFALWITPECKQLVDDCYADDQCQSRSEYIEKAILFYNKA